MKIISTILFLIPLIGYAQQSMTDSTNVINPVNQNIIRFTTAYQSTNYVDGDSVRFRSGSSKRVGLVSPLSFPVSTATQSALNLKAPLANPTFTGTFNVPNGVITNAMLANGSVANLSGTNSGDNATNSQYSGLVSNANHTGDATGSTALTLATVNSNVGSFGSATQAGTFTVNAKGLITAASNTTIAIPESAVTNLVTDLGLKAPLASPIFTGTVSGVTATMVGLGNVTNESKATMFTSPTFTGTPVGIGLPVYGRVTGSNVTTTGQTLVDAAGLSVALAINATYEFEANLSVSTTAVTTGTQYGIQYSVAGGAIEAQVTGALTSTASKTERVSALNTASTAFLTTSAQTGGIRITGIVTTGANAGNLTVRHLKVTSGTSTIFINSFIKVTRIL